MRVMWLLADGRWDWSGSNWCTLPSAIGEIAAERNEGVFLSPGRSDVLPLTWWPLGLLPALDLAASSTVAQRRHGYAAPTMRNRALGRMACEEFVPCYSHAGRIVGYIFRTGKDIEFGVP